VDLAHLIRDVPDFPKRGILFRDITPLLGHADAFEAAVERMAAPFRGDRVTRVVAIESRGFVFGGPIALRLGAGFVPLRKAGRLPSKTVARSYALEYGETVVEMHEDALHAGDRALVVDDVLATGGTLGASVALAKLLGAHVVGCSVLLEIEALRGRAHLDGVRVESLLRL
jgi:adenine phosphoribosyltransferase